MKRIDSGPKKEWHPYILSKPQLRIQIFIALPYFLLHNLVTLIVLRLTPILGSPLS